MKFLKIIATSFFLFIGVAGICALQKHFIAHTNGKTVSPIIISSGANETVQSVTDHSLAVVDYDILEEDNDDLTISEKNLFTDIFFVTNISSENVFNRIHSTGYFYSSTPRSFISLKVFRL